MALTRLRSSREFFRIWFTWKKQAVLLFLLIVAIVMAYSYLCAPIYSSSAKILLLPRPLDGGLISTGVADGRAYPASRQDLNTEIELLMSDEVIQKTVRYFTESTGDFMLKSEKKTWYSPMVKFIRKIKNEVLIFLGLKDRLSPFDTQVVALQSSLKVEPVGLSNIILVTLKGENPQSTALILNKLLEIYLKHHNEVFTKDEGVTFFDSQTLKYQEKLKQKEKLLKTLQAKYNVVDLIKQNDANIDILADLHKEHKNLDIDINEAESRLRILTSALHKDKGHVLITKEMRTIPQIVELEKNIVPLLVNESEILRTYTPESRKARAVREQIEALREQMRREVFKVIETEELELEVLRIKRQSVEESIAKLQEEANRLNEKERILTELEREVDLLKNNFLLYSGKTEDARIKKEGKTHDLANVSIAASATIPIKPTFPKKPVMLFFSILIGFFVALGTPFLLEFLDHRIKTPMEVEDLLSLPIICSFPDIHCN